ncbi:MAG: hypothetical protein WCJ29_03285 [bacterium]
MKGNFHKVLRVTGAVGISVAMFLVSAGDALADSSIGTNISTSSGGTITSNGLLTGQVTGGIALYLSGAPAASATSSLMQLGPAIAGGSASGTYIGINPAAFTGNFMDLQVAGTSKFKVTNGGAVTAVSFTGPLTGNVTGNADTVTAGVYTTDTSSVTSTMILNGTVAGGDLASNIAISTTGSVTTTGAGAITSAGLLTASNGFTLTTGTLALPATSIADAALSANVSLLGSSISSSEITDDTITATDLSATLTFADGDLINLALVNGSGVGEGLILPQNATACSASTAEGQICWDTATDLLYVGTGAAAIPAGNPFGASIDSSEITDSTIAGGDLATNIAISTTGSVTTTGAGAVTSAGLLTASNGFTLTTGTLTLPATSIADAALSANVSLLGSSISSSEIIDDTITATDLSATLTFADGDLIDLSSINVSSTTEGLKLPQTTSCASGTAEGQICWDTNDDQLYVGNGATAQAVGSAAPVYAMFFGLTAGTGMVGTDYAATVAVCAPTVAACAGVPFPQDGAASGGIVSTTNDTFTIPVAGNYEVSFKVNTTEPGQLEIALDDVGDGSYVLKPECTGENMDPTAGGHPINGSCIITTTVSNAVVKLVNPPGNGAALTITPADGTHTHANSQTLIIKKL